MTGMSEQAPFSKHFLIWTAVGLLFGTCSGVLVADPPAEQPYRFNHRAHTRSADCSLCHQGSRQGSHAGLPDLLICQGCHATPPGKATTKEKAAWERAQTGEPVPWTRLYSIPSNVMFSHRRHVGLGGLECNRCHGEMGQRTEPPSHALKVLKMRDCIACHTQEQVSVDCTACHR